MDGERGILQVVFVDSMKLFSNSCYLQNTNKILDI